MLDTIALGLIIFAVIVIVLGIVVIHNLPGKIARRRNNPQAEAIHICSLIGLIAFPFWMVALIWAYVKMPAVDSNATIDTDTLDSSTTNPAAINQSNDSQEIKE